MPRQENVNEKNNKGDADSGGVVISDRVAREDLSRGRCLNKYLQRMRSEPCSCYVKKVPGKVVILNNRLEVGLHLICVRKARKMLWLESE